MQGVTEDTPLWDEDDALDAAATKEKPAKKKPAAKPAVKTATGAIVPKVKKAVTNAARNSAAAAKVGKWQMSSSCQAVPQEQVAHTCAVLYNHRMSQL